MIRRRNAERRMRRFLQRERLMFVRVGEYPANDKVISMFVERNGATVANREFNALVRKLVEIVQ